MVKKFLVLVEDVVQSEHSTLQDALVAVEQALDMEYLTNIKLLETVELKLKIEVEK